MLNIQIKDHFRETRIFGSRLMVLAVVVGLGMLTLFGRLVYLQVVHHSHYEKRARANQVTPIPIRPVRGRILDRNGVVLAQNYRIYTLEIIPEQVTDMKATLERLGTLITLTPRDLRRFNKRWRSSQRRFESVTLRTHLSDEEVARIAINQPYLHGVQLDARLQRHYPLGALGVHMLGYVGAINVKDMEKIDRAAYRGMKQLGKRGIEKQYEQMLMGRVGVRKMETNAFGRTLGEIDRKAPKAGHNIYLNIDARLQALAEQALKGRRGAVVAMDPHTGAVLVFASAPSFDPNRLIDGIDIESYRLLKQDKNEPLFNRALNGTYSPGSTIKPFMALAVLESGALAADSQITCKGYFRLPRDTHRYRDWTPRGHGRVNLRKSIKRSCDVYYYSAAVKMGIAYITNYLTRMGFGRLTGVDLPGESDGLVPTQKWRDARKNKWYVGETVVVGIGQGPVDVTPLQLAMTTSALANGRHLITPRLLRVHENPVSGKRYAPQFQAGEALPITNSDYLNIVNQGMIAAVHEKGGTAFRIGWNAPYKIAGKTGTAQVKSVAQGESYDAKSLPERYRDHALFIAYAPADNPRIAIAVIVENAGHGGSVAAPIARLILDGYLLPNKLPPLKKVQKPK